MEKEISLQLSKGVSIELVLVPAGSVTSGVVKPTPPARAYLTGLQIAAGALLLMSILIIFITKYRKLRFYLSDLIATVFLLGLVSYGILQWHKSKVIDRKYEMDIQNYDSLPARDKKVGVIRFSAPYYIGKFEVMQKQYLAVMGNNPSEFKNQDNPVECVSYYDAKAFCEKASKITSKHIRLPNDREWEYACRAFTKTSCTLVEGERTAADAAWYAKNSGRMPHPAGLKLPNAFGIYDMHGNVSEWCDRSAERPDSENKVLVGGSWISILGDIGCKSQISSSPQLALPMVGFRIVVDINGGELLE